MKSFKVRSLFWKSFLFLSLLVIYFIFLTIYLPSSATVPIILLIGFALFIIGIFYFFRYPSNTDHQKSSFKFQFTNEEAIFLIIIVLMIITFNIAPITFSQMAIDWHQVSALNVFRAVVFLLGSAFIPGSCLIKIFYPNMTLHRKLKVEPFFLKIILYPVLSFCFLGSVSLILDQLGLLRDYFSISLFLILISLYILRVIIEIRRNRIKSLIELNSIEVSRNTAFIIYMAIAIIIIALSIQLFTKYLFGLDACRASNYTNYIGKVDTTPNDKFYTYAIYWSYIIFSFSSLSGIPVMNIGAMMFPFIYLFICSVYLFMKSLLNTLQEKFAILATILTVSFSSLFYIYQSVNAYENVSMFVFDAIFNFRYKGFAIILFFLSITLITTTFKSSNIINAKKLFKSEELSLIIIGTYFLIQSFMIYFLPIIPAVIYIFIMIIFSPNRQKTILHAFVCFFIFFMFFLVFDLVYNFFFSWSAMARLNYFFKINLIIDSSSFFIRLLYNAFMIYLLLFTILIITYVLFVKYYQKLRKLHVLKVQFKPSKFLLQILLLVFTGFFILDIFLNLIRTLRDLYFFTLFLHLFFFYIGFIGITAIYLIYFTYKKDQRLTYILFNWFIITFISALGVFFLYWISNPFSNPLTLPGKSLGTSYYWFDRLWHYSIIPLSILASIGIIEFRAYVKKAGRVKLKGFRGKSGQWFGVSVLIFFCLSNTIISGMLINNHGYKVINDEEAQISGWVSENLPRNSNILVDGGQLYKFLDDIAKVNVYLIDETIEAADKEIDIWTTYKNLAPNCSIEYYHSYKGSEDVIEINDSNNNENVSVLTYFNSDRSYGIINFSIQTSNASNIFNINFGTGSYLVAIAIKVEANAIYGYNGSFYQKVMNISNNLWYEIRIIFNAESEYYPSLGDYQWKMVINDTDYGPYFFQNNITRITSLNMYTLDPDSGYSIYLKDFTFSWNPNYKYEYCLFTYLTIFDYLRINEFYYLILSDESNEYQERANNYVDIWNVLIPEHFNETLYIYKNLTIFRNNNI